MTLWIFLMLCVYTFVSLFLIFVILIQSGKGGGLSSLGSANQGISDALGATGAEKALNRMTTYCAVGFMVLAILISIAGSHQANKREMFIDEPEAAMTEQPLTESIPGAEGMTVDVPAVTEAVPEATATEPVPAEAAPAAPVATEPAAAPAPEAPVAQ